MEGTQCPICGKHVKGTLDETTRHVNMCIDGKNLDYKAARQFSYCPVCYKFTGVNAKHIKSCGKSKGVETKELLSMCAPDQPEDIGKKGKGGKTKKEIALNPFGPNCVKDLGKKTKPKVTRARKTAVSTNQLILQPTTSGFKMSKSNGKLVGSRKNELSKLSEEEKQERIKERTEYILSNTIHPMNCISSYFQSDLPFSWTIASLSCKDLKFIVDGFERFCSTNN